MKYNLAIEACLPTLEMSAENSEMRAALTHWLQFPRTLPPFFTANHARHVLSKLLPKSIKPDEINDKHLIADAYEIYQPLLQLSWDDFPYPPPKSWNFTFIDLFAGIGGFRQAFQSAGGKCVFSSEWDKYAKKLMKPIMVKLPMVISVISTKRKFLITMCFAQVFLVNLFH